MNSQLKITTLTEIDNIPIEDGFFLFTSDTNQLYIDSNGSRNLIPQQNNSSSGGSWEIGDIRTTLKTNLGDEWVKCDGSDISRATYNKLAEFYPSILENWTTKSVSSANLFTYGDGYYVAGNESTLYYMSSLNSTQTTISLYSYISKITCIKYLNGYWFVGGCTKNGPSATSGTTKLLYTTNLLGAWISIDLWTTTANSGQASLAKYNDPVNDIAFDGKYYGIIGKTSFYYSTNLTSWTKLSLPTNMPYLSFIKYSNGYWVLGGYGGSYSEWIKIAYSSNILETFTTKALWSTIVNGTYMSSIEFLDYINGYWIIGGTYQQSNSSESPCIAYTQNLNSSWTIKTYGSSSYTDYAITSVAYGEGYWALGVKYLYTNASKYYGNFLYMKNLSDSPTEIEAFLSQENQSTLTGLYLLYNNGQWVASDGYNQIRYPSSTTFKIPTISLSSNTYSYIKAK